MQRFEMAEGTSDKFWEVEVSDCNLTVRFGRTGTRRGNVTVEQIGDAAAVQIGVAIAHGEQAIARSQSFQRRPHVRVKLHAIALRVEDFHGFIQGART